LIKYENDAIAYETGKGKTAPNMFISPNECLILLNIKNTELRELRHANAVLTGACDMWADKYEALQAQLRARIKNDDAVIESLRKIIRDERASLSAAQKRVEEARKVIENYSDCTDLDDCFSADAFLKKYPKENK
jgi:hypothetical protein